MAQKLFEADFITFDVSAAYARATATDSPADARDEPADTSETYSGTTPPKGDWLAWNTELTKRLDSATDGIDKIEAKFFEEFFTVNWDKAIAQKLILFGAPLRNILKIIGIKNTNPILIFLTQDYVKTTLIHADLLNASTFKAIYTAYKHKLVADSEFVNAKNNTYNLLYCKDLYRKSPAQMVDYFKLQKQILSPSAKGYSAEKLVQNKKIFIEIKAIDEKEPAKRAKKLKEYDDSKVPNMTDTVTLNDIKMANALASAWGVAVEDNAAHLTTKGMQNIVDKLDKVSEIFAAIQFLSMTTESPKAISALSNEKFGGISSAQLRAATIKVRPLMPKGRLKADTADALVSMLMSKL